MSLSAKRAQPPSSNAVAGAGATRRTRLLIFLGVMLLHVVAVTWLVRSHQGFRWRDRIGGEPRVFLLLPKDARRETPTASSHFAPITAPLRRKKPVVEAPRNNAITLPAEPPSGALPKIDWDQEAQLAARNALTALGKDDVYRNLAGLSPEQLKFVRDNHLVPMAPGIVWAHPRVEVNPETLIPIIHINDHCVLVLLIPFCVIGHIRPNDHLFDHRHDTADP